MCVCLCVRVYGHGRDVSYHARAMFTSYWSSSCSHSTGCSTRPASGLRDCRGVAGVPQHASGKCRAGAHHGVPARGPPAACAAVRTALRPRGRPPFFFFWGKRIKKCPQSTWGRGGGGKQKLKIEVRGLKGRYRDGVPKIIPPSIPPSQPTYCTLLVFARCSQP